MIRTMLKMSTSVKVLKSIRVRVLSLMRSRILWMMPVMARIPTKPIDNNALTGTALKSAMPWNVANLLKGSVAGAKSLVYIR